MILYVTKVLCFSGSDRRRLRISKARHDAEEWPDICGEHARALDATAACYFLMSFILGRAGIKV